MVGTKSVQVEKQQMLTLINEFFSVFQKCCNGKKEPVLQDIEKFLAKKFQLVSNETVLCNSVSEYLNRINDFRAAYTHLDIIGPIEEPLVFENKVVLQYEIDLLTQDDERKKVLIMAICTVENQQIAKWVQVTHEKVDQPWDS